MDRNGLRISQFEDKNRFTRTEYENAGRFFSKTMKSKFRRNHMK